MIRPILLALPFVMSCVPSEPVEVSPVALRSADVALAQSYIRESLRDPESARFRNEEQFRTAQGDQILCGEYNATNGFGGYVGYTPYYIRLRGGVVDVAHLSASLSTIGCRKARDGEVNIRL